MTPEQLSPEQLFLIGMIASALVYAINEVAKRRQKHIGRAWLTGILFAVSVPLALWVQPAALPALPVLNSDAAASASALVAWITAITAVLAQVAGAATVIYNIILKRVMDQIVFAITPQG